jgi:hypothetical protein
MNFSTEPMYAKMPGKPFATNSEETISRKTSSISLSGQLSSFLKKSSNLKNKRLIPALSLRQLAGFSANKYQINLLPQNTKKTQPNGRV